MNPYERVDWATFSHYRADLHVHTIQSDGCHHPEEVVRVYREAGFSILAITDHDSVSPNGCPTRDAASPQQISMGLFTEAHSLYPDPRPANFPADTTWPWTDYGARSPAELGILGIEGVELTCGHHRNAFFIDYGVINPCTPSINEQFREVARRGGLAVINHPEPRFKEWYYELYRDHSADYLVGMEISRGVDDATALWDQLLADLTPSRPVWGFATSDMHFFRQTQFAFTVFLLDELTTDDTKEAMQAGRFYSVVGPGTMDLRESGRAAYDGTYPELRSISVDREAAVISIDAANYDEIVWITGRSAWRYTLDPETAVAWPAGEIVHRGPVFNYSNTAAALPYVRAELLRHTDNGPIRLFLNPFALTPPR
jgi:predicted metal-dependent phosphoesterase TrpH